MMNNSVEKEKRTVWRLTLTGLMSALGFVLMLIEIPIPFLIPEFVKFDFSEVPALIATYMLGPVEGIIVCLVKNLLKAVFMSTTGGIGELCNFLLGVALVLPSGIAFRRLKSGRSMLVGGLFGSAVMAALSLPVNYFISYPVYTKFLPIETIVGMYQKINPNVTNLAECLLIFNVPFTFVKGLIAALFSLFLYKHLRPVFSNIYREK